jgi:hypothetical protein
MTHDERIEAMARALCKRRIMFDGSPGADIFVDGNWRESRKDAEAALAAAGVEEMVRKAMWLVRREDANCRAGMPALGDDEMVARVMQGAGCPPRLVEARKESP